MNKFSATNKIRRLPGAIIIAAGFGYSVQPMAQPILSPVTLLPEVFTRLDSLSAPKTSALELQKPESATARQGESVHTGQDLDLALENFFFALEDLMQSASGYEASIPREEYNYFAQVQLPAKVMGELVPTTSIDQASNTAALVQEDAEAAALPVRRPDNSLNLGEYQFRGNTSLNLEHNDNIYTTHTNQRADEILTTSINAVAESKSRIREVKVEGNINSGIYNQNTENNYVDWNANSSFSTLLGARSKGFAGIGYFSHHEDKGEGSTDGDQALTFGEPIEFQSWVARGIYEQGSSESRTRFVVDGKMDLLRTTNYQDVPAIKSRDRDMGSLTGTAYYKWTQRLSYLAEIRHMDIDYVQALNDNSIDSTQTRLALGAEWLATRKTTGSIRIGLQEKQFDNAIYNDTSGISWEALVEWTPVPRTEIVFETVRDTEESDGYGAARDHTDFKVSWSQKWTPRVDSQTSIQRGTTDFQQEIREDRFNLLDAQFTYSLSNKASAILKLTYIDNSSNVAEYGFERSQIQLGLNMALD